MRNYKARSRIFLDGLQAFVLKNPERNYNNAFFCVCKRKAFKQFSANDVARKIAQIAVVTNYIRYATLSTIGRADPNQRRAVRSSANN